MQSSATNGQAGSMVVLVHQQLRGTQLINVEKSIAHYFTSQISPRILIFLLPLTALNKSSHSFRQHSSLMYFLLAAVAFATGGTLCMGALQLATSGAALTHFRSFLCISRINTESRCSNHTSAQPSHPSMFFRCFVRAPLFQRHKGSSHEPGAGVDGVNGEWQRFPTLHNNAPQVCYLH